MSMFEIQYGPRWSNENGLQSFNVSDTNKTAEIDVKANWSGLPDGAYSPNITNVKWTITRDDGTLLQSYTPVGRTKIKFYLSPENVGSYTAEIMVRYQYKMEGEDLPIGSEVIKETAFKITTEGDDGDDGNETSSGGDDTLSLPFKSIITNVDTSTNTITTKEDISAQDLNLPQEIKDTITDQHQQYILTR